jgi:hypothetical protein
LTFLTFAIARSEILKFEIGPNETEILESTFKSTESESESQQSTLKIKKSKELYQEIL